MLSFNKRPATAGSQAIRRRLRSLAICAAGAILGWLVARVTLVEYLAQSSPGWAKALAANNPTVRLHSAREAFEPLWRELILAGPDDAPARSSTVDRDLVKVAKLVRMAISAEPLNSSALRMLGDLEALIGKRDDARTWMRLAVKQSRRETRALVWLIQDNLLFGRYEAVIDDADILMRTSSSGRSFAIPLLAALFQQPNVQQRIIPLLKGRPPWRMAFVTALPRLSPDAAGPLGLLLALKSTPFQPVEQEVNAYLKALVERHQFAEAYYGWLALVSEERLSTVGRLNNGSFSQPSSNSPFDWQITTGSGASAELIPPGNGLDRGVLSVKFAGGRVEFGGVQQTVVLGSGRYRLTGQLRGELKGRRGLVWQVECIGAAPARMTSTMLLGTFSAWTDFFLDFTVPDQKCPAQLIALRLDARSASEQFVTGEVQFSQLALSPLN